MGSEQTNRAPYTVARAHEPHVAPPATATHPPVSLSSSCVVALFQANASEKKRSTSAVTTVQLYTQIIIGLYVSRQQQAMRAADGGYDASNECCLYLAVVPLSS